MAPRCPHAGYTRKHPFFGAVVGRVANRIAKGRFTVEGKEYQLFLNNGPNSLHGGAKGFDKVTIGLQTYYCSSFPGLTVFFLYFL